jgi:WD repeat-containing protein 35
VKWNPNGNVLAVAGSYSDQNVEGKGTVQFYNAYGVHLRSLRVPGTTGVVSSLSWEGFGLRIGLAVDSNILFANIQPEYLWAYFNNTLVFAFKKPERQDMCVVFWDTSINEKHVKYMRRLQKIVACGEYCVLVGKAEEAPNQWIIILCNAVGCPIENKYITIEPKYVAMNKTHVIVACDDVIYYWQYRSQHSKLTTLEQEKKKKSGKENAFHIEEIPNPNQIYDTEKWKKPQIACNDMICSVAAGPDSFIIGRNSGQVYKYTLPYIQLEHKVMLRCRPQQLSLNCDSTKFSIIDINGILSFYDFESTGTAGNVRGAQ